MEFTLHYRGPLKPNAGPKEKQELRSHFSEQLLELWKRKQSNVRRRLFRALPDLWDEPYSKQVGLARFAALVTEGELAELEIVLLRPEPSGAIITGGGDIDNRLKTLLDALRMPGNADELPGHLRKPEGTENPQHRHLCLLEDDRLVTSISVRTHELLEPGMRPPTVVLIIHVRARHYTVDEAHVRMLREFQPGG